MADSSITFVFDPTTHGGTTIMTWANNTMSISHQVAPSIPLYFLGLCLVLFIAFFAFGYFIATCRGRKTRPDPLAP